MNSLEIKNYRGFREIKLDFGRLNFFIGDNNTGKSSVLKVIDTLFKNQRLDFLETYLGDNYISDLKHDEKNPIYFLYHFKRPEKNDTEWFDFYEIDSLDDYKYPLVKNFTTLDNIEKTVVSFQLDYKNSENDITIENLTIKEFKNYPTLSKKMILAQLMAF